MRRQLSIVRLKPRRPAALPAVRREATEPQHAKTPAGVLRLQRTYGNAATSALLAGGMGGVLAVQRQPKPPGPLEKAGQALRGFEGWADDEKKRQNVLDKAAVVGLDPKQASSVQAAAVAIAGHVAAMRSAAGKADPSLATLRTAVAHAEKARRLMLSHDPVDHQLAGPERTKSKDAVQRAIGQVGKVPGVDTAGLVKDLTAIGTHLDNNGSLADVVKFLKRAIDALGKVRTSAETRAAAGQAIDVLLRAFLAVNNPAFKAAPTAAEIATVRSQLSGGLQDEFVAVFDNAVDFEFFTEFANTWGQQIDARTKMTEAGVAAPAVPGRTDAQTYFTAVRGKDNAAVFAAYESFASAFFVHRGIAGVSDLTRTVDDLFAAKASITGRRGMVCTGFATMGAEALDRAGATLTGFKVGIHASDDMVREGKLEESGHAIAQMSRGGKPFCVSNQNILPVTDALEGKDAIVWGDQSNRLFVGSGKTMGTAVEQLLKRVAARKRALP